ncbi:hypothetical protein [Terrihabitans sp. B22-R8]|uniref:hypothetical protein n=1 Tax=Terrihabitans sp. B22-R8 TaxID=3425128 RepID=UPI00403C4C14
MKPVQMKNARSGSRPLRRKAGFLLNYWNEAFDRRKEIAEPFPREMEVMFKNLRLGQLRKCEMPFDKPLVCGKRADNPNQNATRVVKDMKMINVAPKFCRHLNGHTLKISLLHRFPDLSFQVEQLIVNENGDSLTGLLPLQPLNIFSCRDGQTRALECKETRSDSRGSAKERCERSQVPPSDTETSQCGCGQDGESDEVVAGAVGRHNSFMRLLPVKIELLA